MARKVSCVLCTNRPEMVSHALSLFSALEWRDKELVLVEDEGSEYRGEVPTGSIRLHVPAGTPLGIKMSEGVEASSGAIIHKFDDDDYYSPGFLVRAIEELEKGFDLIWWESHLVYFAKSDSLRLLANSQMGGSFVFRTNLAEKVKFRPDPSAIDSSFMEDARSIWAKVSGITDSPELFAYVRHGRNLWRKYRGVVNGRPAEFDVDPILLQKSLPFSGKGIPDSDKLVYQEVARG